MYSGRGVQSQLDQNFASQETLTTLAGDTGGKAFLDTNDLGQVFDRVQKDRYRTTLVAVYSDAKPVVPIE